MKGKIKLQIHGLSLGADKFKPALIFKDKDEKMILPIWLDPVSVGIFMATNQQGSQGLSPFNGVFDIFTKLNVNLKSVYFSELKDQTQIAVLTLEQDKNIYEITIPAQKILALAVNAGCTFWADENVIEKSRQLNIELSQKENLQNQLNPAPGILH